MKFKPLILTTLSLMLIGCTNGTEKVNYDVFHREAVAAYHAAAPRIKTARINGWMEAKGYKYEAKNLIIKETTDYNTLSSSDLSFLYLVTEAYGLAVNVGDVSTDSYYVGNGFRVVSPINNSEIAWDKYLNCTLIKVDSSDASCDVKVSYTYIR